MKKILVILIILHTVSCVSMRKFSSTEALLTNLRKDSLTKENLIREQNDRIDELLRRNIALGRDTLRLFIDYADLLQRHERMSDENRQEIARLNAHLSGTSRRLNVSGANSRLSRVSGALSKSITGFGEEIRRILKNEDTSSYIITVRNWELTIALRDTLLYVPVIDNDRVVYDHTRLSNSGEAILNKLASMIVEKDHFDIVVRENVYINSPNLRFMANAKFDPVTPLDKEVVAAVIDTLMTRGVVSLVASKITERPVSDNAVVDTELVHRLDSIRAVQEVERIKRMELNRRTEALRQRERAQRLAADRTTVVMRSLMKYCYNKLGTTRISRDASYVKTGAQSEMPDSGWVEIILRPDVSELNKLLQSIENRNK